MKILFLTNKLPHAEVAGGHRIIYQRIRYLAENGYSIGLVAFTKEETKEQINTLKPLLTELHTLPHPRRNILIRAFHDYISMNRPPVFSKSYSAQMMKKVGDVCEQGKYDLVIAEFSEMGQYLYKNPYLPAIHKVISCHRCITASYEKYTMLEEVRFKLYLKSLLQLRGLQKYEFNMYRSADRILVLTPQDRFTMQYYAQDLGVSVAPAGVDIQYLETLPPAKKEPIILMTGFMGDPANEDGALWFCKHIWPKLCDRHPEIKFYIVGAGPGPRIRRQAEKDERITVTGLVDDLRPYRNMARVFVSPVRLGSGMRTKVFEAMAGGLPVVSTSLGMAGLEAQTGINCLVADTPELFAQSVEWLLTDSEMAQKLIENGKELVKSRHTLKSGLQLFEKIINSIEKG